MFHITPEGSKLHNGFNFYPLSDASSFGFRLRYGKNIPLIGLGSKMFTVRYSKTTKKWIIRFDKI